MAKYKKRINNAKKIKQATKDYGPESRSNIEENIHQLSSSDNNKDSNSWYDESTDPTSSQDKSSEILVSSPYNNLTATEIKQSEGNTDSINSENEKCEELKPVLVCDTTAKDGTTDADTSIAIKKSVSVVPSPYDDKGQAITTNPFLATMSLWQSYIGAWFRVCNEFFRYPTAITGETWFLHLSVLMQKE
jgi:hypothetical protein